MCSCRNSRAEATVENKDVQEGGGTMPGVCRRLDKTSISEREEGCTEAQDRGCLGTFESDEDTLSKAHGLGWGSWHKAGSRLNLG